MGAGTGTASGTGSEAGSGSGSAAPRRDVRRRIGIQIPFADAVNPSLTRSLTLESIPGLREQEPTPAGRAAEPRGSDPRSG